MVQEYTEEDLLGKKYNELLKISKSYGVKTSKRLKMDKLIEAILKSQQKTNKSVSQTDGNVTAPVEETSQDELLFDVEFPECDSKDFLDSTVDEIKDSVHNTKKQENAFSNTDDKSHKRSGTYEMKEDNKTKKRSRNSESEKNQRKSTFELPGQNDITLPIDEKQTAENSQQLSVLSDKVSVRGSRRNGMATKASKTHVTKSDSQQDSKEDASLSSKRRRSQTEPASSSPWQARVSLSSSAKRRRQSVVVTPSAPAPPLRASRKSCGTPSVAAPLRSSRQSHGTPSKPLEATKVISAASASKPVFTIGCGDKKVSTEENQENKGTQGKGGTGIPRFMSYARRLKMPNFARIHEQASQRMEALDDYMERRKARQDILGSTTKSQNNKNVFQPSVTNVENVNFNFADTNTETKTPQAASSAGKSMQGVSCPKTQNSVSRLSSRMSSAKPVKRKIITPSNARLSRITQNASKSGMINRSASKRDGRLSAKPSPKSIKKVTPKSTLKVGRGQKTSPRRAQRKSTNSINKISLTGDGSLLIDQKVQTGGHRKASPKPVSNKKQSTVSFPVFGSQIKENCRPGKQKVNSPMVSKLPMPSKGATFGLAHKKTAGLTDKSNVKPLRTRDNLKTLAERKHVIKSSKEIREGQKSILKGVRLNRRFELQMANRGVML